mmetsp:Transcript_10829/g.21536  ORF Transcript_10829/g.21536 Transcript_10829/m.21536 type:complete len:208 (-) Transcript_10829:663-1286(-)
MHYRVSQNVQIESVYFVACTRNEVDKPLSTLKNHNYQINEAWSSTRGQNGGQDGNKRRGKPSVACENAKRCGKVPSLLKPMPLLLIITRVFWFFTAFWLIQLSQEIFVLRRRCIGNTRKHVCAKLGIQKQAQMVSIFLLEMKADEVNEVVLESNKALVRADKVPRNTAQHSGMNRKGQRELHEKNSDDFVEAPRHRGKAEMHDVQHP